MLGRFVKVGVRILLALSLVYFVHSCYNDEQDIRIDPVTQPKQWTYDITSVPLGERMYYVLIDGELDQDAGLEAEHQVTTTRHIRRDTISTLTSPFFTYPSSYTSHVVKLPDSTFTITYRNKLPKGKFSMYYNGDDSGLETFTYHPLKATKGWVRIQIGPGSWDRKDSTRSDVIVWPTIHEPK
ncbi:hypothetical protein [Spirosoma luteum]|uniref:hypothetical protein n=1 Tax=Spirosoma luteum TaxID=431553 RepID=UPI000368AA25|nr:hypothetical protein [Spirosoma luteum]